MDFLSERSLRQADHALQDTARYPHILRWLHRLLTMLVGICIFIMALQLLKQGAGEYGRSALQWLNISNGTNALGLGWLLAYVFLSGSPVAAVAVSLFDAGVISDWQTFTMITGSRLGASFVVLLVGVVYYLRGQQQQQAGIAIGVLALMTTAAIYIPALLPGYWLLTSGVLEPLQPAAAAAAADSWIDQITTPIVHTFDASLPGWALLMCGMMALPGSFSLIDRALPELRLKPEASPAYKRWLTAPPTMFLLGAVITALTMSVSVSISLFVPLAIKGIVQPRHSLPYIMGANITTFIDTLVAAFVAGGAAAFTIVLIELISVTFITLLVLVVCYRLFEQFILQMQEQLTRNHSILVLFLGAVVSVPILLICL